MPQPLRWGVGGAILVAVVGVAYGAVESIRDYQLSSWFGVTLYVALLGTLAGLMLGVTAGTFAIVAGALSRRQPSSGPSQVERQNGWPAGSA